MAPSKVLEQTGNLPDVLPFYPKGLCQRYRADQINVSVTKEVLDPARIGWHPDYETYLAREVARLRAGGLPKHLPDGFPRQLKGDLVWSGTGGSEESQYVYQLQDFQKAEVESALQHFKGMALVWLIFSTNV